MKFNRTNDNIEWASWSWNPVTGCKNDCLYCYARDIANRFFPEKFEPTFHSDRLSAPSETRVPKTADTNVGDKNVFVCSMADLFGAWVPKEWIDAVLEEVKKNPQWNFLFLTKNPKRYLEFEFPKNSWLGVTVNRQSMVKDAEETFEVLNDSYRMPTVSFVSCEPLLEDVEFTYISLFSWLIIGGGSKSTRTPETQPKWEWVASLLNQAYSCGCKVYFKPNLKVRPREYPGQE
jgi:protein gp37